MAYSELFNKSRAVPTTQTYAEVKPLLTWVYAWMLIGLIVTTAVAAFTVSSPAMLEIRTNTGVGFGSFIVQIARVVILGALMQRLSPALAALLFLAYAATLGFTLSLLFLVFDIGSLVAAFGTTAILFGVMSIVGFTTDVDLTRIGSLLVLGLVGVIIALVVNMFIGSSMINFLLSIVGVLIFMGLTAYDTQNIKRMAAVPEVQADGSVAAKVAIFAALSLYLNFINIFLFLLRIMGGGSSD